MNKKGFIGDIVTIIFSLFFIVIVLATMALVINTISTALTADASIPIEARNMVSNANDQYPGAMDVLMALFAIGVPLVGAAFAFFLDVSSVFFWLILVASFIYVIFGAALGYLWEVITASGVFAAVLVNMPIMDWIMSHYAIYTLAVTFIILGGLFFRFRRQL